MYQALFGASATVMASCEAVSLGHAGSRSTQASVESLSPPAVLIGELDSELLSVLSKDQRSKIGNIVPLQPGSEGQSRAVSSGKIPSAMAGPGGDAPDIEYLGSDVRLATFYSIVEDALNSVQNGVA